MTRETVRTNMLVDRLALAMHRLILATERDDDAELDAARRAAMDAHVAVGDESLERMRGLVPAWLVERMTTDVWPFGLLLVTGGVLAIEAIRDVTQAADGSLWLDVGLLHDFDVEPPTKRGWPELMLPPTSRDGCSVALAHVVCAVELADT